MCRILLTIGLIFNIASLSICSFLDGDLELTDGVNLVSVPVSNSIEDEGRSFGNSVLSRMAKFLQGHELHVKLPNIIEKEKLTHILAESLKVVDDVKDNAVSGRGKGGGGGGAGLALLGMAFAKSVGAAALGGIGLLAMKALALSGVALLLAALVGVKKMHHDDHHEDDHKVIYAGHHGHHRKRRDLDIPLPYKGWKEYQKNE